MTLSASGLWPVLAGAVGVSMLFGAMMLAAVWSSGGTFGQRCAHAFTDPARQELCVYNLQNGKAP